MIKKRPRRKKNTANELRVLDQSRRRCCLCFCLRNDAGEKRGQIAHLDRDRSNDAFENLAFLCLEHHDEYDSSTSQSRSLQEAEVRDHRDRLYEHLGRTASSDPDASPLHPQRNRRPLSARRLKYLVTDTPHKCSFCGFSFSVLPNDIPERGGVLVTAAVCPKCGNRDKVTRSWEG